jgi:hypothetical protein
LVHHAREFLTQILIFLKIVKNAFLKDLLGLSTDMNVFSGKE